jgi:hypothetical protein
VQDAGGSQEWGGSLRETTPLFADAWVSLIVGRDLGTADMSREYDAGADPGEEISFVIHGLRELTWEIRVESRDSSAGMDATSYLELVRSMVHDIGAKDVFSRSGLGLRRVSPTMDLSSVMGDRVASVAQIDVAFHAHTRVVGSQYGYIEHVYGESEWRDPNGDLYPAEVQFDGEIT